LQATFSYVEGGDLSDEVQHDVLLKLQSSVLAVKQSDSSLECSIRWHDSAQIYPNLVGTVHERGLYKRWQLEMTHLPHSEREVLVDALAGLELQHNGIPVLVYSES
jgi:hypothetical protein